jgi:hypothetical protein
MKLIHGSLDELMHAITCPTSVFLQVEHPRRRLRRRHHHHHLLIKKAGK